MKTKGLIISGEFGNLLARQKSSEEFEIGELLVVESKVKKTLLQVTGLLYGSQISQQNLELISGMALEEGSPPDIYDPELRSYKLASLKSVVTLAKDKLSLTKDLPPFLSSVRSVEKEDLAFITKPKDPIYMGKLRSGTKTLDVDIFLPAPAVLTHHILIPATTGRGKSNLTSCLLWDQTGKDYSALLVLDPHDEYYGRNSFGLKDHPDHSKVVYYTSKIPPPGTNTLRINLSLLKPHHFDGISNWSTPQRQLLSIYYKEHKEKWIEAIILEKPIKLDFHEGTFAVVKRRFLSLLNLDWQDNKLYCNGIFTLEGSKTTISDICASLESSCTVIIDTSSFSGELEILVGSLITSEVFSRYKHFKYKGTLDTKPVINIIIEEAPRVLGHEVLEQGSNVFASIAREGRKFNVGLTAITQLPSLIPREILANINTKIILGVEMSPERKAIIDSASQDLSQDDRNIASLDVGEALITTNFSKFAIPIRIPLFADFAKGSKKSENLSFSAIKAT